MENDEVENEVGTNIEAVTKGRKRKRNQSVWKRVVNTANRHSGKVYMNKSGRHVPEKTFKNVDCKCARRCFTNVQPEERQIIFKSFYKLSDNTKQNIYLCGLIHNSTVRQRRGRNSSRHQNQ